jgi:hypothetical protein
VKPTPTAARVEDLTARHIHRYEIFLSRARAGDPGYRESELVALLAIWRGVAAKGYQWKKLNKAEKDEVWDAMMDEEGC